MKRTIGLLGGMSWESSLHYYRLINQNVQQRLGGLHSAKSLMFSVDFAPIAQMQSQGEWGAAQKVMVDAAKRIENGGGDCLVICTNTMHKMADSVQHAINIPLIHIADATGNQLVVDGINTVGLLGTQYTMLENFYKDRLITNFGINVVIPNQNNVNLVNQIIYDELCKGIIKDTSRKSYEHIINTDLLPKGAEAIILGCTEIGLLVQQKRVSVPLYDTTIIHAMAAVDWALT